MLWVGIALALVFIGLVGYWLLITTEGVYLGTGVVTLLYDWTAERYNGIKQLNYIDEASRLGIPLARRLQRLSSPRVLDVATGTGRLPLALMRQFQFDGTVVGMDRSQGMLREAQRAVGAYDDRITLLLGDAQTLSFRDTCFDSVTCLEALEFMPDAKEAIREMLRVLKPGGVLLLSNRVGKDAWFFPGQLCGRGNVEDYLRELGMKRVHMERWQVHYDLIWARKDGDWSE
ncbi:MAG: class I SAM-dependent methyltransferase [Anaerolineales bacterium]